MTASRDGTVRLWDSKTGKFISSLPDGMLVSGIALSPDGKKAVYAQRDKKVAVWDIETNKSCFTVDLDVKSYSVAYSLDGKFIAVANDGGVSLIDARMGKPIAFLKVKADGPVFVVEFSPDGKISPRQVPTMAFGSGRSPTFSDNNACNRPTVFAVVRRAA